MNESAIEITTPDGIADGYIYRAEGLGPRPGVLLLGDGVGIRPAKREMAARLAASGYVVLLPNLFYRDGPIRDRDHPGLGADRMAAAVASSGKMALKISQDGGLPRDLGAYLRFLAAQAGVGPGKLGTTGYCMGGHFSLVAAGQFPDLVGAAGCFHGSSLATDSLASPHRQAHAMSSKVQVYVGVAEIDPYLAPDETIRLQGALEGADVSHVIEFYPGVEHGFTVPGNAQYDEAAAERHWKALLTLYAKAL